MQYAEGRKATADPTTRAGMLTTAPHRAATKTLIPNSEFRIPNSRQNKIFTAGKETKRLCYYNAENM
jgi:hypothetical protein